MLINDGKSTRIAQIFAPFTPPTPDYAVEAEIQYVRTSGDSFYPMFGLVGRMNDEKLGYALRFLTANGPGVGAATAAGTMMNWVSGITHSRMNVDSDWHTYRIEFIGNQLRVFMDGGLMSETTDNTYLDAGKVGLFSSSCELNVRSFKVEALE